MPSAKSKINIDGSFSSIDTQLESTETHLNDIKDKKKTEIKTKKTPFLRPKTRFFPACRPIPLLASKKSLKNIRKAYIRHITSPFPSKDLIELIDDDHIFIQQNSPKFQFHQYQLLNENLLQLLLMFLATNNLHNQTAANMRNIIEQLIQNEEMPFDCSIYKAYQAEMPSKFYEFVQTLSQRCRFCFTRNSQFESNINMFVFKLYQPRVAAKNKKLGRPVIFVQSLQTQLIEKVQSIEKPLQEYHQLLLIHKGKKSQFLTLIVPFLHLLKEMQLVDGSGLFLIAKDMTLQKLEQLVINLIQRFKKGQSIREEARKNKMLRRSASSTTLSEHQKSQKSQCGSSSKHKKTKRR